MGAAPPPRSVVGPWAAPVAPGSTLIGPDVFRLLNIERPCRVAQDWRRQDAPKLWLYHLHYFDDLNAGDATRRRAWHAALLERWVAENAPGEGPGWDPYPISRRIVNWVKWTLAGNTLPADCHRSLAAQARWLMRRLEYHLLGNHLFANGKALMYAGLYFDGPEADSWYRRGFRLIASELPEQVLSDGGHFERSPMYHASALEDLLDLVNLHAAHGRQVPLSWLEAQQRMRHWLRLMCHPDGGISFFNDAAFGMAPSAAELERYTERLKLPLSAPPEASLAVLEPSGYVRIAAGAACVICDCGPVGPDYLPGHAHADTLSFEMSLGTQRVFVNSGTSQYGADGERHRQRGTAAHNTVIVEGENSSEVWGGFRVARRARAQILKTSSGSRRTIVEASHDGYTRLAGRNRHTRRWTLDDGSLCVEDHVSGPFRLAEANFHLHPNVTARVEDSNRVSLSWGTGGSASAIFEGAAQVDVRSGTWHPEFGVSVPNQRIVARLARGALALRLEWDSVP